MLLKAALVLLLVWYLGVMGVYNIGQLVHVVLLFSLMILLLAVLKRRDADAARRTNMDKR